jgi:aspartyl-tRNA(Asn)/glutamyl-tRNA(Gln) amidotransferase subunit B
MEKGQLRCDVNVSVRPRGSAKLGTKIEVKNLNSFRYVQKAIEYEFKRQTGEIEAGRPLVQSTHLFDPKEEKTRLMRIKEGATDYRYFPEPDLPPLDIAAADVERIRAALPELPGAKRDRLVREFGIGACEAGVLTAEKQIAAWFEAAVVAGGKAKPVANWMVNELARILNETKKPFGESKLAPAGLVEILALLDAGTITAASAKEVLAAAVESGCPPADIVKERGLAIVTDTGEIEKAVADVIAVNPKAVADKDATIKFLVGQVMKSTRGRVKATTAEELLRKHLAAG